MNLEKSEKPKVNDDEVVIAILTASVALATVFTLARRKQSLQGALGGQPFFRLEIATLAHSSSHRVWYWFLPPLPLSFSEDGSRTGARVQRIRTAEQTRSCGRSCYFPIRLIRLRSRLLISRRKVRLFFGSFKFWCFRRSRSQFAHVQSNSRLEGRARCPQLGQTNQSQALWRAMALNSEPSTQ